MPIQIKEEDGGKILIIHVSGTLVKADYEYFMPEVDRLIEHHGKLRLLFDMTDFHGWEANALWEDIKFDVKHFADIDRLAMVGETKWQHATWFPSPNHSQKRRSDTSIMLTPRKRGSG